MGPNVFAPRVHMRTILIELQFHAQLYRHFPEHTLTGMKTSYTDVLVLGSDGLASVNSKCGALSYFNAVNPCRRRYLTLGKVIKDNNTCILAWQTSPRWSGGG